MKPVARYQWGKREQGYGWHRWEGCGLSLERDGQTGHWGIYEADGSLFCLCVDYRSAQRVVARLRLAELARLTPDTGKDFALLVETAEGLEYQGYSSASQPLCGSGQTFPTLEAAERYLVGRGQVSTA
jgi:hypothetical protein